MMTKYFVNLFIASIFIAAAVPHGASARGSARVVDPPTSAGGSSWMPQSGEASYYGPFFNGRLAANGTRFDQTALTAAHKWLPFGTRVRVMLDGSRRSVVVTITDRISSDRRIVDLSVGAARALGMIHQGVAQVTLTPA